MYDYTMNSYQADVSAFMIYKWKVIYPILGLAGEAGETAGKLSKHIRDSKIMMSGEVNLSDSERADMIKELGDCLWMIAAAAKDLNVSLNDVAKINIEKLKDRQNRGVLGGSGDNR